MDIWYYVMTPFTLLLKFFCQLLGSYGLALVFFALVVKLILFPLSLKGKKSMIQMNMLSGKMNKLQKQYKNNQQKYNEEVQKLYEKEGVNPMGGCLWSFLPLLILFPLYAIIRQPLKYMMGMTPNQIAAVAQALNWSSVALEHNWIREAADFVNAGYNQLYLSSLITPENVAMVQAAAGETAKEVFAINFSLLGVNLSLIPKLKFWVDGLKGFGLFLVPAISAGTSLLFSFVTMRTSSMNSENSQAAQNKTMLLMSPLMSLWIGFSMPAALSVYWIANNLLGMAQEKISHIMLKKDYEEAAVAAKQREIEEKEEEKRLRREKAERRAKEAEEARLNKGKKKAKTEDEEKLSPEQKAASRVGMRQYARGRAYDPDRFGGVTPYHEDVAAQVIQAVEQAEEAPLPETAAPETETAPVVEAPAVEETPAQEEVSAPEDDLVERLQAEVDAAVADDDQEPKED